MNLRKIFNCLNTSEHCVSMFFKCISIPICRIFVRSYVDDLGNPLDITTLNRYFHFISIQKFEQVTELELATVEVIK
ncbi:hypothetical protein [Circoviridae sp.]|nr:hypothetical protein [Circoviridae sp.]